MVAVERAGERVEGTPKRVVLVSQPYYPDIQSTSHLLTELLEGMQQDPIDFTVLCGYPTMIDEDANALVEPEEIRANTHIIRCGWALDYKRHLLLRLFYMLGFVLVASLRLVRAPRGALVVAVTNPPFSPLWIGMLSRLCGFPFQILCHDVFPDGLNALGQLSPRSWLSRMWKAGNRWAFGRAERMITLGRDMNALLEREYGVPPERLVYIPHWSINDGGGRFEPESSETWREADLKDAFVVQYSGNMGLWHDIDALVEAAAILKDKPKIRFLFVGDGRRKKGAMALAKTLGADNITWLPFQPESRLTDSLSACSLAIISQREGLEGVAVPCKLYGILASGRGILAMVPEASEVAKVVEEEGCGLHLAPSDSEELAKAIEGLAEDPERVREWGARAYRAFDQRYRLEAAIERYRDCWLNRELS